MLLMCAVLQDKATQEVLILRSMHHPHILPIHTCFLAGAPCAADRGSHHGPSRQGSGGLLQALQKTSAGKAAKPHRLASQGSCVQHEESGHADDTAFASPERVASNGQVRPVLPALSGVLSRYAVCCCCKMLSLT